MSRGTRPRSRTRRWPRRSRPGVGGVDRDEARVRIPRADGGAVGGDAPWRPGTMSTSARRSAPSPGWRMKARHTHRAPLCDRAVENVQEAEALGANRLAQRTSSCSRTGGRGRSRTLRSRGWSGSRVSLPFRTAFAPRSATGPRGGRTHRRGSSRPPSRVSSGTGWRRPTRARTRIGAAAAQRASDTRERRG